MPVLKGKPLKETKLRIWTCYFCQKQTTQRSNLFTHLRSHTKETPWKCSNCSESFLFPNRLKNHLATKHPTAKQLRSSIKCSICKGDRTFLPLQLKKHNHAVHSPKNHKCSYCYMTFFCRSKLEEHFRVHTREKQHSCYFCGKSFFNSEGHRKHMLNRHLNEKPDKCDKCSFRTYAILILNAHKRRTHPETDRFTGQAECRICNKWYRASYLHYHVQSIHGGIKLNRFICYFCGYQCNCKTQYEAHMRSHTLEKPNLCDKCPFRATRKLLLNRHIRLCHEKTTRYICPHCSEGFVFAKDLTNHMQSIHHEPNSSKIKLRDFATDKFRSVLEKNLEGNVCYFCSKEFQKKSMYSHIIMRHTREKPYICKVCKFSTNISTRLSNHYQLEHN